MPASRRVRNQSHVVASAMGEEFQPSVYSTGTQALRPYYSEAYGMWPFDDIRKKIRNKVLLFVALPLGLVMAGSGVVFYLTVRKARKLKKSMDAPIDWSDVADDGTTKEN